jgi:hypothetical protein
MRRKWEELLAACMRCFAPRDEFEAELVTQIAAARWRMRRTWAVETGLFDSKMDAQDARLRETCATVDEGARLAAAFTALADETSALGLVTRYETRLRRSFESALDRLHAHRDRKKIFPNEPDFPWTRTPRKPARTSRSTEAQGAT